MRASHGPQADETGHVTISELENALVRMGIEFDRKNLEAVFQEVRTP